VNVGAIAFAIIAVLAVSTVVFDVRSRRRTQSTYDRLVGRDLAGLIELLPEELRDKEYTRWMLAPERPDKLTVGLVYRSDEAIPRAGNPANVGIDFDLKTGAVIEVHPGGVGLGIK
jgi:hypothetical protein